MKNIKNLAWLLLPALFTISACKKETHELDLNLSAVGTLATPNDNVSVKLEPTTSANILFKWNAAATQDGGVILYELVFDKESGDFSKPIAKVMADGGGVQTQVTLSHKELNKIASKAGVASLSSGKLKWAVIASKATASVLSLASRTLTMARPAGFAENPAQLYLTGSATEGGSDLSKAIPLKRTEDGLFEVYTSLKAGEYFLTDKNTDGGKKYSLVAGVIVENAAPVTVTGAQQTYRLNFDFTSATTKSTLISAVGLYMSAYGKEIGTLNYVANGVFEAPNVAVEFFQFSWGRDERYKFILHTANGDEYMGSVNQNNDQPAGKPASYFELVPVSNSQWDNTYKFDPSADRKNIKVNVTFQPNAYTHKVTVL
jgi:hypothetical protein